MNCQFIYVFLGYKGGLHLVLNTEQHEYVFFNEEISSEAGYFVRIHDPETQELNPGDNAYFAPAGSITRISLQKEQVRLLLLLSVLQFTTI